MWSSNTDSGSQLPSCINVSSFNLKFETLLVLVETAVSLLIHTENVKKKIYRMKYLKYKYKKINFNLLLSHHNEIYQ